MTPSIPPHQKRILIRHIQDFFYEELGEEIGIIAAERFLDFVALELAPVFYNQGVKDARKLLKDQMEHLEMELSILEKPLNQPKRKG